MNWNVPPAGGGVRGPYSQPPRVCDATPLCRTQHVLVPCSDLLLMERTRPAAQRALSYLRDTLHAALSPLLTCALREVKLRGRAVSCCTFAALTPMPYIVKRACSRAVQRFPAFTCRGAHAAGSPAVRPSARHRMQYTAIFPATHRKFPILSRSRSLRGYGGRFSGSGCSGGGGSGGRGQRRTGQRWRGQRRRGQRWGKAVERAPVPQCVSSGSIGPPHQSKTLYQQSTAAPPRHSCRSGTLRRK